MAAHFEPVVNANCRLVAPPQTRRTAIGGYPKVASCDMLGEQLQYSKFDLFHCRSNNLKKRTSSDKPLEVTVTTIVRDLIT